ncbi:DNA-binding transcriptional MerR regulator [Rhodoblastus sphagnicola]|nr:MerR family transcriptional regulator [Rhodoblastus sphagnicola]MBB4198895.1 DNA-binding transcriptional MerR regulator [Rhodoblastus sphagnicola]
MEKTTEAFRTIGEVADELDLPQHVLRFWETKFIQIRPVKRAGGRRYYRQDDVALVAAIRVLLYSEGYTIKGVQRILKEQGARAVIAASNAPRAAAPPGAPIRIEPEALALPPALRPAPAPAPPRSVVLALAAPAPTSVVTRLSPQDRHRLEAILAELTECARLLA